jgi:hypothetical protein
MIAEQGKPAAPISCLLVMPNLNGDGMLDKDSAGKKEMGHGQ